MRFCKKSIVRFDRRKPVNNNIDPYVRNFVEKYLFFVENQLANGQRIFSR